MRNRNSLCATRLCPRIVHSATFAGSHRASFSSRRRRAAAPYERTFSFVGHSSGHSASFSSTAAGAARQPRQPRAASGRNASATAGTPWVRYQCQGCAPYASEPPSRRLNLAKFHAARYHRPLARRSNAAERARAANATGAASQRTKVNRSGATRHSSSASGIQYSAAVGRITHEHAASAKAGTRRVPGRRTAGGGSSRRRADGDFFWGGGNVFRRVGGFSRRRGGGVGRRRRRPSSSSSPPRPERERGGGERRLRAVAERAHAAEEVEPARERAEERAGGGGGEGGGGGGSGGTSVSSVSSVSSVLILPRI